MGAGGSEPDRLSSTSTAMALVLIDPSKCGSPFPASRSQVLAPSSQILAPLLAPALPQSRDLAGQLFRGSGRIERNGCSRELMPKPGLLALGVLPGTDGDRLRHGLPWSLPVQVLYRLTDTDPIEAG